MFFSLIGVGGLANKDVECFQEKKKKVKEQRRYSREDKMEVCMVLNDLADHS